MTTDIHILSATNLFDENEVLDPELISFPKNKEIGGCCWLVESQSVYEGLLRVLKFVYGLVRDVLPKHQVWLLVGSSAWQPDTRVVRYHKLWNALALRGLEISHSCNAEEVMHERDGKIKFFGAARLSELSIPSVVKVLIEERAAYLAVLPGSLGVRDILKEGWIGDLAEDSELVGKVVEDGGLIARRIGEFDDQEVGILCIGSPGRIKAIIGVESKRGR